MRIFNEAWDYYLSSKAKAAATSSNTNELNDLYIVIHINKKETILFYIHLTKQNDAYRLKVSPFLNNDEARRIANDHEGRTYNYQFAEIFLAKISHFLEKYIPDAGASFKNRNIKFTITLNKLAQFVKSNPENNPLQTFLNRLYCGLLDLERKPTAAQYSR